MFSSLNNCHRLGREGSYFFMRIVTVEFVTVIEETFTCPLIASISNMYSIFIKITSLYQEVLTATGRPRSYPAEAGILFYDII